MTKEVVRIETKKFRTAFINPGKRLNGKFKRFKELVKENYRQPKSSAADYHDFLNNKAMNGLVAGIQDLFLEEYEH